MQKDWQVVTLVSGLMFGGGQRVALDLAEENASSSIGVQLLLLGCGERCLEGPAHAIIDYDGSYDAPAVLFRTAIRLRRYLQRHCPRILHTHGWDADIIGWLAICGMEIRQICHLHVTPDWLHSAQYKHRFRRWLTRRALARRGTRVIAVAEAVQQHWRCVLPRNSEKTLVIRNGVDVNRYWPAERPLATPGLPVIGTAVRLMPSKGIEYLLQALKMLADEGLRPTVKIAGDGPLKIELKQLAEKFGLAENVAFLGRVAEMSQFYRSLDLFVLPSIAAEGLPLAALEAMATGLPVLATHVGGTAEAIRDDMEGLIVDPRDAAGLAHELQRLLCDRALRRRLGQSARRRVVREFSLKQFTDHVFDVYRSIVEKN